ncbi:MAG TPA: hypothetical protein VHG08_09015 [Longimicrobium sp.]|nr:hypothetical protein [Longimicrobium sp.]
MGRRSAWLALALAAACTPGSRQPAPGVAGGERPREPGSAGTTGREFGVEYHALIQGTVVGASGQPLQGVEVVTDRMMDATPGSMPRNRAVSGGDGRFSVPAQASFVTPADTARVQVVLVAFGRALVPSGASVPVDSVVVPVTMVRTAHPPNAYTVRLTLPVPP